LPLIDPHPPQGERFVWLAGGSLVLAVVIGAILRAVFAGVPLPFGSFPELRHAHSHLGYYGVLFPLAWWAWIQGGPRPPGRILTAIYGLAVLAATIGFAREGYGFTAIVASTVVLLVWLTSAWRALPRLRELRSWYAVAAPAIVGSAITIPLVAINFQRDPAFSSELVQLFLTLLLFGVIVPAALAVRQAPPPLAPLWALGTVCAALALGPWPTMPTLAGSVLLGLLLLQAGYRLRAPWDQRALWLGLGAGLIVFGLGLVVESHAVGVAGLHYAVLGPVLVSLGRPLSPRGPRWICLLYEALVVVFCAAIIGPQLLPGPPWPQIAAACGGLVALSWIAAFAVRGWRGE